MLPHRTCSSTQSIYQDHEIGFRTPASVRHSPYYLSGRYSVHDLTPRRPSAGHDDRSLLPGQFRVRNQFWEIMSPDWYDSTPPRLLGGGNLISVFQHAVASRSVSAGTLSTHRKVNYTIQAVFPPQLHYRPGSPISRRQVPLCRSQRRTALVACASALLQRESSSRPSPDIVVETNAARTNRVGAIFQSVRNIKLQLVCSTLLPIVHFAYWLSLAPGRPKNWQATLDHLPLIAQPCKIMLYFALAEVEFK